MKPFGRVKNIKGGGRWKTDVHPKKGFMNWWEGLDNFISRSGIKRMWKKEIEK
jgi:hypothetical protein